MLYFLCLMQRREPKNIVNKMDTCIPVGQRYYYYILLSFVVWNLETIFWKQEITLQDWQYQIPLILTFPIIMYGIIQTQIFQDSYNQVKDKCIYYCKFLITNLITKSLNFLFEEVTGIKTYFQEYEIKDAFESFQVKNLVSIFKLIASGFVYDYLNKYYNILLFQQIDDKLVNKYKQSLQNKLEKKDLKAILTPRNISKILLVYYQSENSWLYQKIHDMFQRIYYEIIRFNSYWSLSCFINYCTSNLPFYYQISSIIIFFIYNYLENFRHYRMNEIINHLNISESFTLKNNHPKIKISSIYFFQFISIYSTSFYPSVYILILSITPMTIYIKGYKFFDKMITTIRNSPWVLLLYISFAYLSGFMTEHLIQLFFLFVFYYLVFYIRKQF